MPASNSEIRAAADSTMSGDGSRAWIEVSEEEHTPSELYRAEINRLAQELNLSPERIEQGLENLKAKGLIKEL